MNIALPSHFMYNAAMMDMNFVRKMHTALPDDAVVVRYRADLDNIYGDRIERVVLFGSRARGNARPDSDYDIAVFLKGPVDRWQELRQLADLRVYYLELTGVFFDTKPFKETTYTEPSPLMHEIRREGLLL